MNLLAESKQYIIFNEYETVMLKIKESQKMIQIGDFYGNPQMAIISDDEKFCVMCGCGIIIYYLREEFEEYQYHKKTSQWVEWGRSTANGDIWVENVKCLNDQQIEILTEDGKILKLNIYKDF